MMVVMTASGAICNACGGGSELVLVVVGETRSKGERESPSEFRGEGSRVAGKGEEEG